MERMRTRNGRENCACVGSIQSLPVPLDVSAKTGLAQGLHYYNTLGYPDEEEQYDLLS